MKSALFHPKAFLNTALLLFSDLLTLIFALFLAHLLRVALNPFLLDQHTDSFEKYLTLWFVPITILLLLFYEGLYTRRYDFWEEYRRTLKALGISLLIVMALFALTQSVESYSRLLWILFFILCALLFPLTKLMIKKLLFTLHLWSLEVKVMGEEEVKSRFEKELLANTYVGYVPKESASSKVVFILSEGLMPETLQRLVHDTLIENRQMILIPYLNEINLSNAYISEHFNTHTTLINLPNRLLEPSGRIIKSLLEYTLILLATPLILPLLAIIALLIKLDSKGSIFYTQPRLGLNGKLFPCYKFRSMYPDGKMRLEAYLKEHPEALTHYTIYHKYPDDPRITRIGYWLRRFSLDELPQFLNVLKGEMHLIGPRPYMQNERTKLGNDYDLIRRVKPGLSGLWQVSGRSQLSFEKRIALDVWYIRNWTLWMDFIIIIKTLGILRGEDAL